MKLFPHERHPDTTLKHTITKDEIDFLIELQKELNTQTNDGNAQPIYWVIMDFMRDYNVEDGTPVLCNAPKQIVLESNKEIADYIKEELDMYVHEYDDYTITLIELLNADEKDENIIKKHIEDGYEHILLDMDECEDFLKQYESDWEIRHYEKKAFIVNDLMFLTRQSAEDYLKSKGHNHSEDAHTYAMTALYNPVVEKLWKILREVDFSKIKSED